ncbi:arylsulfotransferase [Kipferlia bialata]|uniref:Arylsulfotransferase n=1 Tax=Kipferlia bialata TaxID=797122 RepID=A0A9K3CTN3_9EUKA|nr:arylsulfotransferase [Kipferlia bialata]|eukprot:g3585.t1
MSSSGPPALDASQFLTLGVRDVKPPQPVGTEIMMEAFLKGIDIPQHHYAVFQFSVSQSRRAGTFRVIQRYSERPTCTFVPMVEGIWYMRLDAKLRLRRLPHQPVLTAQLHIDCLTIQYEISPIVKKKTPKPMISTTDNALVAMYTVPPSPEENRASQVRIAYRKKMKGKGPERADTKASKKSREKSVEPELTGSVIRSMQSRLDLRSPLTVESTAGSGVDWSHTVQDQVAERVEAKNRWRYTAFVPVMPGKTTSLLVGGLEAQTVYEFKHQFLSSMGGMGAEPENSPGTPDWMSAANSGTEAMAQSVLTELARPIEFQTDKLDKILPEFSISTACEDPKSRSVKDFLILSTTTSQPRHFACPSVHYLSGKPVWFLPGWKDKAYVGSFVTRALRGGTFLTIRPGPCEWFPAKDKEEPKLYLNQELVEIDLLGKALRRVSVSSVNDDLKTIMGSPLVCFSQDADRLPDGSTVVLGQSETALPMAVQMATQRALNTGKKSRKMRITLLSDVIVVLDTRLRVCWTWRAADHIPATYFREPFQYVPHPKRLFDMPLWEGDTAFDHTHATQVSYLPGGDFLVSLRSQDWLVRVDYRDGAGDGDILWKLGPGGDFKIKTGEQAALLDAAGTGVWWSHQFAFSASTLPDGRLELVLFDNGCRINQLPEARSVS